MSTSVVSFIKRNVNACNSKRLHSVVSSATSQYIDLEEKKSAHNYHPIPVVLARGKGVNVWDVDGKVCVSIAM